MAGVAGFDCRTFPGIDTMDWMADHSNLRWCAYYLAPAPNRPPSGWQGQYLTLKDRWGILPVYVGQQDPRTATRHYVPSSTLTADQGTVDGADAAKLASDDGFPKGNYVYLDWEQGDINAIGARDYMSAWIAAVASDGRAMPGIYCSHNVASNIAAFVGLLKPKPVIRFWCWNVSQPVTAHNYNGVLDAIPAPDPSGCGYPAADAWQREQNAILPFPAGAPVNNLQVDLSTASSVNPGAPLPPTS